MSKTGPELMLEDKEMVAKIKQCILEGKNLKETAKVCEISESTIYHWHCDNVAGIADKIEGWKRDRKVALADDRIEDILQLDPKEKEYTPSVLKASMFIKETLEKDYYSKRSELTGAGGKDLPTPIIPVDVSRNDVNEEDQGSN